MKKKVLITFILLLAIVVILIINYKTILKLFYRTEYSDYVEKYSQEYDIDKYLIYSIIKAESNFDSNAQSNKGAIGLMQIMDKTAKDLVDEETDYEVGITLFNPEKNIELGTKYFRYLLDIYNNIELSITAYNAGIGNVDKWIEEGILNSDGSNVENIPYNETNMYVRRILNNYKVYKICYENNENDS